MARMMALALATLLTAPADAVCDNATGLLANVTIMVPDCIGACEPQVCDPLSEVIDVFATGGGEDLLKRVVCRHVEAFACLVSPENLPNCSSMLDQAADLGFAVPRTAAALSASCRASGGNQDLPPNATNATTVVTTTTAGGTSATTPNATNATTVVTTTAAGGTNATTTTPAGGRAGLVSRGARARAGAVAALLAVALRAA